MNTSVQTGGLWPLEGGAGKLWHFGCGALRRTKTTSNQPQSKFGECCRYYSVRGNSCRETVLRRETVVRS